MSIDRRLLLGSLAAVGFSTAAQAQFNPTSHPTLPPPIPPPPRLRKPVSSLSRNDPNLAALRRAIPRMRASGAWDQQIALHADMGQRHHASWRFLPWHRMQLVWFERLVAQLGGKPDFALPYWDWDDDRVPDLFYDDPVFQLEGREAGRGESIRGFLSSTGQRFTGRLTDDFATFFGRPRADVNATGRYYSGSAEWSGHNMMHGFVGGDMGRLDRSPNDPIFWMHHANIDRLWTFWADRHAVNAYPPAWRNERLAGFVDLAGRPTAAVTAASTVSTATFGYAYPVDPTPPMVFAVAPTFGPRLTKDYAWAMKRTGPTSGVIDIAPRIAAGQSASAVGYIEVIPDPTATSVVHLRAVSRRTGQELFSDSLNIVGMGHTMGPQGHRINLDHVWGSGEADGVSLLVEVGPLGGRRGGEMPATLSSFVVDARVTFGG